MNARDLVASDFQRTRAGIERLKEILNGDVRAGERRQMRDLVHRLDLDFESAEAFFAEQYAPSAEDESQTEHNLPVSPSSLPSAPRGSRRARKDRGATASLLVASLGSGVILPADTGNSFSQPVCRASSAANRRT